MADTGEDERFMGEALSLAHSHLGATGSNPSVGCVLVRNDGDGPKIVGRAVTAAGGRPHAETQALAEAGEAARGATAYVTLEPCSHHGRTPPCANALVAAGIARVVVSVIDPDERVSGRGIDILRDAGIEVLTCILQDAGERALEGYLMRKRQNRPYVTVKLAVSADGMIGIRGQGQVRITGGPARDFVQQLRAETDAILVGIGTAIADDPELTCRIPGLEDRSPLRIVLDPRLDLPTSSKLAQTAKVVPVIVVGDPDLVEEGTEFAETFPQYAETSPPLPLRDISPSRGEIGRESGSVPNANRETQIDVSAAPAISPFEGEMSDRTEGGKPTLTSDATTSGTTTPAPTSISDRRARLEALGVEVVVCHPAEPADLLAALATRGISSLLVEGGARTAQTFLNAGLVDRILLFTGPSSLGADGVASPLDRHLVPVGFVHMRTDTFGGDVLDTYEYERTL